MPVSRVWKIILSIVLFLTLYIFLPACLTSHLYRKQYFFLFYFYFANLVIISFLAKKYSGQKYSLLYKIQELEEESNIVHEENSQLTKNYTDLDSKIARYNSLKKVVEEINDKLDLDPLCAELAMKSFLLIPNNRGNCILYLLDRENQELKLFKAKKEDSDLVIKEKEGDIFDLWVLRHAAPLFIEDIKKDFRFDLEKLKSPDQRQVCSLISSPLISEEKFLGILRLDSPEPNFYTQDDLRFLVKICDLGAVAIENSEFFEKTQELAIHDALTGLFTKGYFLEHLKDECRRDMHQKKNFCLLMLDIDFFKNYNDNFGHVAGDIVLKEISKTMTLSLGPHAPVICRFGGEEFCVILPGIDCQDGLNIAESLRKQIASKKIVLRRQETFVTVSIGVSCFPRDSTDETELVQKADLALYRAKQKGRNQVCYI